MRNIIISIFLVIIISSAQMSSVAYPDDPFAGIENPAYMGILETNMFAARAYGRENTLGSIAIAGNGYFLGTLFNEDRYSLDWGLAVGDKIGGMGYIDRTLWLDGKKIHSWRAGVISRPIRWLSWGITYSEYFGQDFRTGMAIRPATDRITLWADMLTDKDFKSQSFIVGGEILPIDGIHLYGSYDIDSKTAYFGARFDFGHLSISGGSDQNGDFPFAQTVLSSKRFRSLIPFRTKSVKLTLKGSYPESPSVFGKKCFRRTMDAVGKIVDDERVNRIIIRDEGALLTFAQREELRNLFARFKARGGKIIVYADNLGNGGMYLYSIADTICLPPAGDINFYGIGAEITYYKGLLDKIGVKADMIHIGEYKTAAEPYSADSMSRQMREEITKILARIDTTIVEAVADGRNVSRDMVRKWIVDAPQTAQSAVHIGMIDTVAYFDEFKNFSGWKKATSITTYSRESDELAIRWDEPPQIAIIPVEGSIIHGASAPTGFLSSKSAGDKSLTKIIEKVANNRKIKGVILRIDSPGGSAFASDQIWHSARKCGEKKKVWASMGSYAASGGYYIASAADKIFADETTITGSIGVLGGKFSIAGLYQKLGLRKESVYMSPNANLYSLLDTFSTAQRERMRQNMEQSYSLFKSRVLLGRKDLTPRALEKIAQGKVHTGKDAVQNGLVDNIAGIYDVEKRMAQTLEIENDYEITQFSQYTSFDLWEFFKKYSILPRYLHKFVEDKNLPIEISSEENLWYIVPYILELK